MAEKKVENRDLQLQITAMYQQLERSMKQQYDELHARLDALEVRPQPERQEEGERPPPPPPPRNEERIQGVKLTIPAFKGRSDPEAYLEWELKIEHVFACNTYTEAQKVKLASTEFSDYALIWWNKLQRERRRDEEPLVETWAEMKRVMRKRYVPSSFQRDLKLKLQKLSQGSKGVDEFYKEMEVLMMQANIDEDPEVTMARFLSGLNHEIRDIVELQEYVEMEDLLHKALQVEQQLKRKGTRKSPTTLPSNWKDKVKKEVVELSNQGASSSQGKIPQKGAEQVTKKGRDVKCFRCQGMGHYAFECPTKKTILLKDNGEYTSESEGEEEESDDDTGAEIGEVYMIRRLLGSQTTTMDANQRENIFHTRCSVNGKICLVIIDGGSCTNVVSARLVSKMNMETKPHPRPYKLQWLSEGDEVHVKRQAVIPFTIGKYQDKVLCDVVPMEASHILLGRPWQFDTKAIHDGFSNKVSFIFQEKKVVLKPLSPKEVSEDQRKLREKIAKEKESETQESEEIKKKKREICEGKQLCLAREKEIRRELCANHPLFLLIGENQLLHANQFENYDLPL